MAEIAGLVLGAVPLLISALEHYEDFVEPTVAFFRWKGQLSKVTRRLLMAHTAYEQNVRLLLKQAASSEDLSYMIDNPHSQRWREERLVSDLQSKLGHAYMSSISTIEEMAKIMVCIAASLNIDGSDKVTQEGLEAIVFVNKPLSKTPILRQRFEFRKRVEFTMKRRTVDQKLKELEECNDRLYQFLEKAEKIQDNTHNNNLDSRIRIRFVAPLQNIKDNASKVHQALHRSWCTAHKSHRAGLLLEPRLVRRKRKNWRGISQAVGRVNCFEVSLWRVPALNWLDTEFRLEQSCTPPLSTPNVPKVSFSLADTQGGEHTHSNDLEVVDICSTIQAAAHPLVGFSLDSLNKLRGMYQVQGQQRQLVTNCITLEEFLPVLKRDFALSDFYSLAITLVSSVLQLGETPWLNRPWSKENIIFLRMREEGEDSVDIKHPYITSIHDTDPLAQKQLKHNIDRLNMLALAIMLLEINLGVAIESLRGREDMGSDLRPNAGTDFSVVNRSLEIHMCRGNLTSAFTSAITYCLQCYLDPTASFTDSEFLKTVEERVLEPLEREMQVLLYGPQVF